MLIVTLDLYKFLTRKFKNHFYFFLNLRLDRAFDKIKQLTTLELAPKRSFGSDEESMYFAVLSFFTDEKWIDKYSLYFKHSFAKGKTLSRLHGI